MASKARQTELFPIKCNKKVTGAEITNYIISNYYSNKAVEMILGVSEKTLYRYRKSGKIPDEKILNQCVYDKNVILEIAQARLEAQREKKGGLK